MVAMKSLKEQLEEPIHGKDGGQPIEWRPYALMEVADVVPTEAARTRVVITWDAVRCKQPIKEGRHKGEKCNNLLVLVDVERKDAALTDAISGFCERCGEPYNLGQYR